MAGGFRTSLTIVRRYYPDVEKVVDAKRSTKITVTKKDCENGVGRAPNLCAIAKAAMRQYDGAIISLSRAYLIKGKIATRYDVPGYVTRELVAFDKAHAFEPGIYSLEKISPYHLLGRSTGKPPKNRRKKYTKFKKRRHYTEGIRTLDKHPR